MPMIRPRRAQDEELLRMRHGQFAQQDLVRQREDGRVSADAEREREDGHGGKARRLSEHAGGEEQIPPQRVHYGLPATRADDFFRAIETPNLQPHCPKRILAAHALFHLFFGCHLLVGAKLLIQLPVDLLLSEKEAKPARYISQQGHHSTLRSLENPRDCCDLPAPLSRFAIEPLSSLRRQSVVPRSP